MSISVTWDNDEKTVIRYEYSGRWTLEDFNAAYLAAREMVSQCDYTVHFIIDVRDSTLIPSGALSRGRGVVSSPLPNEGRTVVVGANALIRSIMDVFQKIHGRKIDQSKFTLAGSMEEAYSILSVVA